MCSHIPLFAVGHFIRKNNNNIRNLYIDFDNTGENLRLITIKEMAHTHTHTNTQYAEWGGNTIAIHWTGIFLSHFQRNFITEAQLMHVYKKEYAPYWRWCCCHFPFTQCIQRSFLWLIITHFFAVIEQHAVCTLRAYRKTIGFHTIFVMDRTNFCTSLIGYVDALEIFS